MSDITHSLVIGGRTRMVANDTDILTASHSVASMEANMDVGEGPNLSGSATSQRPQSLALNLNLDLDSNSLTANDNRSGTSNSANGSASKGGAPAATAANTTSANTNINSNNSGTISTPVIENKMNPNTGPTKSATLATAYSSVNSMSNDSSTNAVRMFQRMDELSARFIVMEEMFQKLCKTVEEQSLSMADLKLQNSQLYQVVTSRLDEFSQQQRQSGEHPNDQDSFVTDLLNSITNVSSSYLRKIRSRSRSGSNRISPIQQPGMAAQGSQWHQYNQQLPNTQNFPHTQSNNVASDKTFTLNPNGIKRRRRNNDPPHSNATSGAPSYTDLASLNNLGTISLPNLTLDHTGITPLLRNEGNVGAASERANGIAPLLFPSHLSQDEQRQQQQQQELRQRQPRQNSKSKGIHLEMRSELASANEEEDGYQEEDDEDEHSILAKTDSSTGGSSSSDDISVDEEDEGDEADKNSHAKHKNTNLAEENIRNLIGNSNDVSISNTPDRDERLVLKNSRLLVTAAQIGSQRIVSVPNPLNSNNLINRSPSSRDLNYTLLKAPSDVKTIWQEYVSGIGGDPPIKKLEEKYGNKWRLNRNRKTFARRKRLYKFILNGISRGKSADEMIDALEHRRLYTDENGQVKRRTIGWLQQSLTGI